MMDMGAGMSRSMNDIVTAMSACFTLLYLFAALLNWFLLQSKADDAVMRGVIIINVSIFGICFALMAVFAFLPPMVMTGLVFVGLLITLISFTPDTERANIGFEDWENSYY